MPSLVQTLIRFFFPPLCVHCGREGAWFCAEARDRLTATPVLRDPLRIPGVENVLCRGSYDEPVLAALVQRIKYAGWSATGESLLEELRPLIGRIPTREHPPVIVPVPLHRRRWRERGFNQAEVISIAVHRLTGWTIVRALTRSRQTRSQATLGQAERLTNVSNAFQCSPVVNGSNSVILVDDVITTGSTIRECASVLRKAGVKSITAIALAKG